MNTGAGKTNGPNNTWLSPCGLPRGASPPLGTKGQGEGAVLVEANEPTAVREATQQEMWP